LPKVNSLSVIKFESISQYEKGISTIKRILVETRNLPDKNNVDVMIFVLLSLFVPKSGLRPQIEIQLENLFFINFDCP
jgi:hypothetical protein